MKGTDIQKSGAAPTSARFAIEQHALFTPDTPALIDADGHSLSWHELNSRANSLADRLCELGASPNCAVGLRGRFGAAAVVGWLAAAKADAPVIPLGATEGHDVDSVLALAGAKILLCAGESISPSRVIAVSVSLEGQPPRTPNLVSRARPEHPAFVVPGPSGLFRTSQRELSELVRWKTRALDPTASHRVCIALPPTSPAGLREIAATLAIGGTVCLVPPAITTGAALWDFLSAAGATRLYLPCEQLESLSAACEDRGALLGRLRDLVIVGGTLRLTPQVMTLCSRHALCRVHMMHHATDMAAVGACTLELPFASWSGTASASDRAAGPEPVLRQAGGFSAQLTVPSMV